MDDAPLRTLVREDDGYVESTHTVDVDAELSFGGAGDRDWARTRREHGMRLADVVDDHDGRDHVVRGDGAGEAGVRGGDDGDDGDDGEYDDETTSLIVKHATVAQSVKLPGSGANDDVGDKLHLAWQLAFNVERVLGRAFQALTSNLGVLARAGLVYLLILVLVEALFRVWLGHWSFHLHGSPLHSGSLLHKRYGGWIFYPVKSADGDVHRVTMIHFAPRVLHLVSIFLHDVFVYYPMQASYFYAIFSSLRHNNEPMTVANCLKAYRGAVFFRIMAIAIICFLIKWGMSWWVWSLPVVLYFQLITCFVLAFAVDYPEMSLVDVFVSSSAAVHSQFFWMAWTMMLCFLLAVSGLVMFGVGIIFTGALAHLVLAFSYHEICGIRSVPRRIVRRN